jgi:hypothetical protein
VFVNGSNATFTRDTLSAVVLIGAESLAKPHQKNVAARQGQTMALLPKVGETEGDDRYAAISFAGIYMLVVWFDAAFGPSMTRAKVRRAVPMIESLVLQLPPSDGPDAGEAEGVYRMRRSASSTPRSKTLLGGTSCFSGSPRLIIGIMMRACSS